MKLWEEVPTKRVDLVSAVDESVRKLAGAGAPPVTPRRWLRSRENMKRVIWVLLVMFLMYVSLRIGFNIGTTRALDALYTENVNSAALNVQIKAKALKRLKNGETDKAIELLERTIDNDLCFLAVSANDKHLKDKSPLFQAIKEVKTFRNNDTGYTVNHSATACVNKAFDLVK